MHLAEKNMGGFRLYLRSLITSYFVLFLPEIPPFSRTKQMQKFSHSSAVPHFILLCTCHSSVPQLQVSREDILSSRGYNK